MSVRVKQDPAPIVVGRIEKRRGNIVYSTRFAPAKRKQALAELLDAAGRAS